MRVGLGQQFCSQFWMLVERKMNPLALQTVQEIFHPDKCLINTERGAIILPIQLFFRAEDVKLSSLEGNGPPQSMTRRA